MKSQMNSRFFVSLVLVAELFLPLPAQRPGVEPATNGKLLTTDHKLKTQAATDSVAGTDFGEPIAGINPFEFELFRLGLEDFLEVEDSEEGLGPVFNGRSCAECHAVPRVGGSGTVMVVRAGLRDAEGRSTNFPEGSLVQMFSIPSHELQPKLSPETAVVARRRAPALFGNGLVEAVPDELLLSLDDPDDADGDGISGRAHVVHDPAENRQRVGRFGWKAQVATLMTFGAEAYRDEMGITNDLFPDEACPVGVDCELLHFLDPVPDPEDAPEPATGLRGIDNFNHFMLLLGPPPRGSTSPETSLGEEIFARVSCDSCHLPLLRTGPHRFAPLSFKTFAPYSDFLLHDVGTGDGIRQGDAAPEEFRTPPLWGLRVRAPFLHDGRAATVLEAVQMHQNEADGARQAVEGLSTEELQALLAFLGSL